MLLKHRPPVGSSREQHGGAPFWAGRGQWYGHKMDETYFVSSHAAITFVTMCITTIAFIPLHPLPRLSLDLDSSFPAAYATHSNTFLVQMLSRVAGPCTCSCHFLSFPFPAVASYPSWLYTSFSIHSPARTHTCCSWGTRSHTLAPTAVAPSAAVAGASCATAAEEAVVAAATLLVLLGTAVAATAASSPSTTASSRTTAGSSSSFVAALSDGAAACWTCACSSLLSCCSCCCCCCDCCCSCCCNCCCGSSCKAGWLLASRARSWLEGCSAKASGLDVAGCLTADAEGEQQDPNKPSSPISLKSLLKSKC